MDQNGEKPERIPALSALFSIHLRRSLLSREAGNPFTFTNRRTGIRFNHRIQRINESIGSVWERRGKQFVFKLYLDKQYVAKNLRLNFLLSFNILFCFLFVLILLLISLILSYEYLFLRQSSFKKMFRIYCF